MDRLADEILQLVFNELDDPLPFASVSRRCRAFYRDPYVRARYLLTRSGHSQALYVALGRPDFTTERVIDILLTSGAHLSRYLVQLAAHHYFRTPVPFIKHPWVKSLPFPLFAHFLRRATERLGDFSTSRGEDDGALFCTFVKESRLAPASRTVSPEHIEEMLARYKFMPFCDKDPIMAQFPLALAVEPRFLPLAVANGFRMDSCYRDYVFRRMFERSAAPDAHARKTLHNVRELCRLDPSMFVSRTVAAEVCMEAQANAPAYSALKSLDRAHELKFELSTLVHDLIHNFASTRSITTEACAGAIQFLYRDLFPASSSVAVATSPSSIARVALRPVLLLSVFASAPSATAAHTALGTLGLVPLDGVDLRMLLRSPFIESFGVVGSYASVFMAWGAIEVKEMLEEVAVECLGISSKGGMLKAIVKRYPEVADSLARAIRGVHSLSLDMLPRAEDERACAHYTTSLCGDLCAVRKTCTAVPRRAAKSATVDGKHDTGESGDRACEGVAEVQEEIRNEGNECNVLGRIGQLTLTAAINHDELTTARRRRYHLVQYPDFASLLPYPADAVHTARFLALHFGARHRVTAELMKHVMLNQPAQVCTHYVAQLRVPVTMVHFRMLARLGRAPAFVMFSAIEDGAKFYEDEEGYLLEDARAELLAPQRSMNVTMDAPDPEPATVAVDPGPSTPSSSRPGRKRPRRSAAATVKSYALPPSSDEDEEMEEAGATSKPTETEMSKWIRHLSVLHRDEIRKVNERKKRTGGRVAKSDFVRFLGPRLREWRRREDERVRALVDGGACGVESEGEGDDGDDGEYRAANVRRPAKRRRT